MTLFRLLAAATGLAALLGTASPARADWDDHWRWHRPWYPAYRYAPPPVYYAPRYVAPPVLYVAPPVVVYVPPPVWARPYRR